MSKPIPKLGIMDIDPYVGGLHTVEGVDEVVVLASNEGPLGASPSEELIMGLIRGVPAQDVADWRWSRGEPFR